MTAIAAIWRTDGRTDAAAALARMQTSLRPYGPHDQRGWNDGTIALGRSLHRVLPEDRLDRQPLVGAGGRLMLVADMRLDNRAELAAALGESPGAIDTRCDAAWALAAFERWGDDAVNRLVGDFALILWDRDQRRLLLARDPLGRRPLFVHRQRGLVAVATMPKGLHALPEVPRAPNVEVAAEFLLLMPAAERATMWEAIERVPPGATVTIRPDGETVQRWWQPPRPLPDGTKGDFVEGLRHHLDQAVTDRLRGAERHVATHLSAGFDSSSVTATAARLMAGHGGRVTAFTSVPVAGYPPPDDPNALIDEGPLAAATAMLHPQVEHVLLRTGHQSPVAKLDRDFFLFDSPILNRCNMGWFEAAAVGARDRGIAVMLTGEMGNMSLSYGGQEYLVELLLGGRWVRLLRVAMGVRQRSHMRWRTMVASLVRPFLPPGIEARLRRGFIDDYADPLGHSLLRPDVYAEGNFKARAAARGHDVHYRAWRNGWAMRRWVLERVDAGTLYKGALAGWGIDHRDPTGDRRLLEFCLSVPMEQYVRDGEFRSLAKRALADRLPQAVLGARVKGVQAYDWHIGADAARAEIAMEAERLAADAAASSIIDSARLQALLDNWPTEGWNKGATNKSYRLALLRGISTGHFIRRARGGNG